MLSLGLAGLLATAQEAPETVKPKAPSATKETAPPPPPARSPGRRFDLNFPGGTPQQLADAISKQLHKSINVIIPDELRDVQLPPLKMSNVTLDELFAALSVATQRFIEYATGWTVNNRVKMPSSYTSARSSHGFRTADKSPGEDSIWYFYYEGPPRGEGDVAKSVQPACRYWNLSPYLDGYKVEDITTAVETGWKMQGATPGPKLSFHKDTKLLIGVGQALELEMVDDVLRQLEPVRRNPASPRSPANPSN